MYSLVSAPVLGFDLTRLAGGSGAAQILARALALHPDELADVAAQHLDEGVRAALWADVEIASLSQPTVRDLAASPGGAASQTALELLEQAPIGSLDGLLHCVRYDVLDWTWTQPGGSPTAPTTGADTTGGGGPVQGEVAARATSVLCDALVASYLRERLDDTVRRRLAAGWVAVSRRLSDRAPGLGPSAEAITALLHRVESLGREDRARLLRAAEAARQDAASWAPAIHSASWAVHLAGRVREAAAAQFLLVRAVETGGIPVSDRAAGVWNLLSGGVQALAARDLIDAETGHRLLAPLLAALGPAALGGDAPSDPSAIG